MDIAKVKGIGPASVKIMAEHGLCSVEDIVAGGVEKLLGVPGFSSIRAARINEEAKNLLAAEMPAAKKVEEIAEGKKMKGGKTKNKSKKSGKEKSKKKSGKSKKKEKAAKKEKRKKQKGKKKAKK